MANACVCRGKSPISPGTLALRQPRSQRWPQKPLLRKARLRALCTSPMVGTVYVAPEPGKPPYVKVGDIVKEGDTLLIVEAMKTMNPILSPRAGTITEICIADAQPVEFGQTLLIIV